MATTKYCVVRTDKPSGEAQMADMLSLRFYGSDGKVAEVENGVIAELQGLETIDASSNQHEIYKAVAATSSSNMNDCAIICSPELMYDERKKMLDEFINEAGKICRAYRPHSGDIFSVTIDALDATDVAVGNAVSVGEGVKLAVGATADNPFGTVIAIDQVGKYTYYVIQVL